MPFTPEGRRQMEEAKSRNRGARWMRGEGELMDSRYGARTIGVMAEITPGLAVYTTGDDDSRRNWKGDPLGGYVLHIDAGWSSTDPETGEIRNHPARFRCYDPEGDWPHHAFPVLGEEEVNRDGVTVPPAYKLVIAVRRFCHKVADHDSLNLDAFDAGLVTDAARLVAVLMAER